MRGCLSALDAMGYSAPAALVAQAISHFERQADAAPQVQFSSILDLDKQVDFSNLDDLMDFLYHR
jgi:hypothetical protein